MLLFVCPSVGIVVFGGLVLLPTQDIALHQDPL